MKMDELLQKAIQEIASNHRKIIDDWCKAYLAQLYEEGVDIKPGCFILYEEDLSYKEIHERGLNSISKKYYFKRKEDDS
jgi:hypothetical protein